MAASIKATTEGLNRVDQARKKRGWTKKAAAWCDAAGGLSASTLDRFWAGQSISQQSFVAICKAVGIEDWETVSDLAPSRFQFKSPVFSNYDEQTWSGRETLVNDLLPKLQGKTRLLWITGISGIGKTALGECLASLAWKEDRAFQWIYLEVLEGQSKDFASVAANLLVELGEIDLDPQERNDPKRLMDRLIRKLNGNRYWLQVDSLERLLSAEQPTETEFADYHWVTFLQRCLTEPNFVSRLVLTAQALPSSLAELEDRYPNLWQVITLQGLLAHQQDDQQPNEHLELFAKNGLSVDDISSVHLRRIGQIYEGHPLVLQVIAKEILALPFDGNVATYWQRYGNEFEQVARELQVEQVSSELYNQALQRRVRRRVEVSLKRLPSDALDLLCRSSVYRRPVPETFWLSLFEEHPSQLRQQAYQILNERAFVEREGIHQNQFLIRQHNLIRAVAYDSLKVDPQRWHQSERQAAHLWLTAYEPAPDVPNLETARGCLEAFDHYCEVEDWEAASEVYTYQLAARKHLLNTQLFIWGYFIELLPMSRKLVDKISSQIKGRCLTDIGNSYRILGDIEKSINYHQQALQYARETGHRFGESLALGDLGIVYCQLGKYEWAVEFHQQALVIAKEIDHLQWQASCLGNLGNVYDLLGQYEQAIDLYQQHLAISTKTGSRNGEGDALCNLGRINYNLGYYERAIDFFQQYLIIAHEIGDRRSEGMARGSLAVVYESLGQYKRAIDFFQQYLTIAREIGDRQSEGIALGGLGAIYRNMGQYERAIDFIQQALIISREVGDRVGEGGRLGDLGLTYKLIGQYNRAINILQQRLAIAHEIGDRLGEAIGLGNLGSSYCALGNYSEALDLQNQKLSISREIHSRQTEGYALSGLGEVYIKLEQYADALKALQNALEVCNETGERFLEAEVLKNLAELHRALGEIEVARQYCQQALVLATELGIPLAEECRKLKKELKERRAVEGE